MPGRMHAFTVVACAANRRAGKGGVRLPPQPAPNSDRRREVRAIRKGAEPFAAAPATELSSPVAPRSLTMLDSASLPAFPEFVIREADLAGALVTRALTLEPGTLNREARTVDAVLSTGADVRRTGYVERLDVNGIEFADSVPLLDSHRRGSIRDVIGTVGNIRIEGGHLRGTLRISDDDALARVADGSVRGVSVGLRTLATAESRADRELFRTITRSQLCEASLVVIPADAGAVLRTHPETPPATVNRGDVNRRIRSLASAASMTVPFTDELIDRAATEDEAREAIRAEGVARSARIVTQRATVGPSCDDPAVMAERMAEGLACRMMGTAPSDAARPYAAMGLADCARALLTARGEVAPFAREELLTRAMHGTSDFPNLLQSVGFRVLLPAYQAAQSPILAALCRTRTFPDFRPVSLLRVGEFQPLAEVTEHGEVKSMTLGEGREGYSLRTFAGMFALTRRAIVNDDLNAFGDWANLMGRSAAEREALEATTFLTTAGGAGATAGVGPVMGDGKRMCSVAHGNYSAPSNTNGPVQAGLSVARQAMRMMRGLDGVSPVGAVPKYLLVGPDLETSAEQALTAIMANTVAGVNVFGGKLELLVESRLPPRAWWVFADPASLPVLEVGRLASAPGPQLAQRDGWEVLGREFRIVSDFAFGAIDWRGAFYNGGTVS